MISLLHRRERHTYEGLELRVALMMSVCLKYRVLRVLATRELGFSIILQTCLANRALLKWVKSRNPKPPSFFGILRYFQDFQWILCSLPYAPPPEIGTHRLDIVIDSNRDSEIRHSICRNCLNYCFYEHLPTSFREEPVFPPIKYFCCPIFKITKL